METEANYSDIVPSPLREISGCMTIFINIILVSTNSVCLVSLTVACVRRSRTVQLFDFYVIALSAVDILECLIPGLIWVTYELTSTESIGSFSCTLYRSTVNSLQVLSLFIIFTMTLYCSVTSTFNVHPITVLRLFLSSIIGCGLVTTVFVVLSLFSPVRQSSHICLQFVLTSKNTSLISFVHLVLFLSVSFLLMGGCIVSTVCNLRSRDRHSFLGIYTLQDVNVHNNSTKTNKHSLHKITALINLFQILTWLPFLLSLVIIHSGSSLPVLAVHFLSLSTQLNGAFNPLIYAIFSKKYRSFYKRLLPNPFRYTRNKEKQKRHPNNIYIHRSMCTTQFSLSTKATGHNPETCLHSPLEHHLVSFPNCNDLECDVAGKEIIMRKFLEDNPIFDSLE